MEESRETIPLNFTYVGTDAPTGESVQSYAEPLPENCPPLEAKESTPQKVWRLVRTTSPTQDDFRSHAFMGKPCPARICACMASSCSVFKLSPKKPPVFNLPKFKNKFVATLDIGEGSGKIIENDSTGHIDLWIYKEFNPLLHIDSIVKNKDLP